ncbi:MAG: phosphoribosylformylglycinamidine cyclo-ligase [Candidatus Latescibacterota bacterium]
MPAAQSAYARAGVDIHAANRTKKVIKDLARTTFGPGVVGELGAFAGVFAPPWRQYREPVLVSSVDSVGTKLKLAFLSGIHDTVGADIVNHCANDILVLGARPLFFLDYLALGSHEPEVVVAVLRGLAGACRDLGCALIGGETAELPGFYAPREYDLAGTIVGIVERDGLLDGSSIEPGDRILGLASNGLHTNGYSLARRVVLEQAGLRLEDRLGDTGRTVIEEMLRPHRAYVHSVHRLMEEVPVKGMVHITGGGFWDNVPRTLPAGLTADLQRGSWAVPPVFAFIEETGAIDEHEMYHVFNMGIGMMLFVAPAQVDPALALLRQAGEDARLIGEVSRGEAGVRLCSG